MEREIKFRGKRVDTDEWIYGSLFLSRDLDGNKKYFIVWYEKNELGIIEQKGKFVYPESVGQFTGLKDIEGRDIYEGDIIVQEGYIWFTANNKPNCRGVVEWVYSEWQVILYCVNPDTKGISSDINEPLNDGCFEENKRSNWIKIGNYFDDHKMIEK